jgi:hypothetical protein
MELIKTGLFSNYLKKKGAAGKTSATFFKAS